MKINYRRFDDNGYAEIEVSDFVLRPDYKQRKIYCQDCLLKAEQLKNNQKCMRGVYRRNMKSAKEKFSDLGFDR